MNSEWTNSDSIFIIVSVFLNFYPQYHWPSQDRPSHWLFLIVSYFHFSTHNILVFLIQECVKIKPDFINCETPIHSHVEGISVSVVGFPTTTTTCSKSRRRATLFNVLTAASTPRLAKRGLTRRRSWFMLETIRRTVSRESVRFGSACTTRTSEERVERGRDPCGHPDGTAHRQAEHFDSYSTSRASTGRPRVSTPSTTTHSYTTTRRSSSCTSPRSSS